MTQKEQVVKYWKEGAKKSLSLAKSVFRGKYYDHALFCGHLALEKLLKAIVVEFANEPSPRSHDLLYLAGLAKIDLTIEQQKILAEVNTFNIAGRYPEEKLEFYKRVNKNMAGEWLAKIGKIYLWLSKLKDKN